MSLPIHLFVSMLFCSAELSCCARVDLDPVKHNSPTSQLSYNLAVPNEPNIWRDQPWPCEVYWEGTSDRAVAAVYFFAPRGGTEEKGILPWLLAGIWADGRVVISGDQLEGGRPYFRARVTPQAVTELVRKLTTLAVNSKVRSELHHVGPDYGMIVMQFRTPEENVYGLGSWHELMETPRKTVMTDRGLIEIHFGEQAEEVLAANASPAYVKFRHVWSAIRSAIDDALPKSKEVVPDKIVRFVPLRPK